jgi:hypothetical protein
VTTKGYKDILRIGNQSRPNLFDLSVTKPGMLYEKVLEVDERVLLATEFQLEGLEVRTGTSGELIQVSKAPGGLMVVVERLELIGRSGGSPKRPSISLRRRSPITIGCVPALIHFPRSRGGCRRARP